MNKTIIYQDNVFAGRTYGDKQDKVEPCPNERIIMLNKRNKTRKIVAILVFVYVGIGTLAICASYPNDILWSGDWVVFPVLFTFPVTITSFVYRFVEADILYPVFIIQSITLIISLFIADLIVKKYFKKKDNKHKNYNNGPKRTYY